MPDVPNATEIVYLIAIAHVFARGTIFAWIRSGGILCRAPDSRLCRAWRALFDCALCSGVWVGLVGHQVYLHFPVVIETLGTGSLVGTGSLTVYGAIRAIPVPPKKEENANEPRSK